MPDRTRSERVSLPCESDSLRSKRQSRQAQVKECAAFAGEAVRLRVQERLCKCLRKPRALYVDVLKLARDGGEMTNSCAELLGVCARVRRRVR